MVPKKKRKHDWIIMDKVNKLNITTTTKQIFNNWRIYFQVDSCSDITQPNGNKIYEHFLTRKGATLYKSTSKLKWPTQEMPGIKHFSVWVNIIKTITKSSKTGNLKNNLGPWTVQPLIFREFKTLINYSHTAIVIHEYNTWWKLEKSHNIHSKVFLPEELRG
jgi:hypothetical protein